MVIMIIHQLHALKTKPKLAIMCARFGMALDVNSSEPWVDIRQELVFWHGVHAFYLLEAEIKTFFNMIFA